VREVRRLPAPGPSVRPGWPSARDFNAMMGRDLSGPDRVANGFDDANGFDNDGQIDGLHPHPS
ncbi:MAG: hypothetical protein OXC91_07500, partial [Rhodobacteraceae bacterium]|nr:hypothetical protein [Paracoccaceae bacterium]